MARSRSEQGRMHGGVELRQPSSAEFFSVDLENVGEAGKLPEFHPALATLPLPDGLGGDAKGLGDVFLPQPELFPQPANE